MATDLQRLTRNMRLDKYKKNKWSPKKKTAKKMNKKFRGHSSTYRILKKAAAAN